MPDPHAPPPVPVSHQPELCRFEAIVEGHLAHLDYRIEGEVMNLYHTAVPPQLEGRGIAARLVATAMAHVRDRGMKVRPQCSYVQAWLKRHPEAGDLRAGA